MSKKRRQRSPDLKAKVGLEALKGIEPVHAIASRYEVHPVQVSQWKQEAAGRGPMGSGRCSLPTRLRSEGVEDPAL